MTVRVYRDEARGEELAGYAGDFMPLVGDVVVLVGDGPDQRHRVTERGIVVTGGEAERYVVVQAEAAGAGKPRKPQRSREPAPGPGRGWNRLESWDQPLRRRGGATS